MSRATAALQILISEMFYTVSAEPEKTAQLLAFWLDLLEYASAHPSNCFLEPHRLTLLPFVAVAVVRRRLRARGAPRLVLLLLAGAAQRRQIVVVGGVVL